MSKRVAANGATLETVRRITSEFHSICSATADTSASRLLDSSLAQDVEEFSQTLRSALIKHMDGAEDALDTFKAALKQRSALLSNPIVRSQGHGDLDVYLRNIVHLDESGDPQLSLQHTKALHSNALDPHYQGITPQKPRESGADQSQPIL